MKKLILIIGLFVGFSSLAQDKVGWFGLFQADYFVNSETGSDSNSGLYPWQSKKTITSAETLASAGDRIGLTGDFTTFTASKSGTSGNQITYKGVGGGATFYGSEVVAGSWAVHSGNIYKITIARDSIEQLFLDDTRAQIAREPNYSDGYALITTVTGDTLFTSTDLDASYDYIGGEMIIRTDAFTMRNVTVNGQTGQQVAIEAPVTHGGGASTGRTVGNGFWITNTIDCLDEAGEWCYDGTDLYLWTPSGDTPENYTVRISTSEFGIDLNNNDYITIRNLTVKQSGYAGINSGGADNIEINNVRLIDNNVAGVYTSNTTSNDVSILYSTISGSVGGAKMMIGDNPTITNTTITDIGQIANVNKNVSAYLGNYGVAIYAKGDSAVFEDNTLTDIGYIGINFQGLGCSIKRNYINGACQVIDDGAGIYAFAGSTDHLTRTIGSVVEDNIILNVIGNNDGYPQTFPYKQGYGIYMDYYVYGVTMKNNTISGGTYGFLINDKTADNVIENNVLYDNIMGIRTREVNTSETDTFRNNTIYAANRTGYYSRKPETGSAVNQRIYDFIDGYTGHVLEGNTFITPYSTTELFQQASTTYNTLSAWQTATSQDADSELKTTSMPFGHSDKIIYNESSTQTKKYYLNYATNVVDIDSVSITSDIVLQPNETMILQGRDIDGVDIIEKSFEYEPEVALYISGITLSDSAKSKINYFVKELKSILDVDDLSDRIDVLRLYNNETEVAALRNIAQRDYDGTTNATFTAWEGLDFDGVNDTVDSNFNPSLEVCNYSQDDASYLLYFDTLVRKAGGQYNGAYNVDGTSLTRLGSLDTSDLYLYLNSSTGQTITTGFTSGLLGVTRESSTGFNYIVDSNSFVKTATSTDIPSQNFYTGARNYNGAGLYAEETVDFELIGEGLTNSEVESTRLLIVGFLND